MSNAKIPIWMGLEPYGALNTDFRDYSQDKHHNQLAKDEMLDRVLGHHKPSYRNQPSNVLTSRIVPSIFSEFGTPIFYDQLITEALEHIPIIRAAVIPVVHHLATDER